MVNDKLECLPSQAVEEDSSCKASGFENGGHPNGDALPFNLVCRFSVSSTHLENGEVHESSDSTDADASPVCRTPPGRKFDSFAARPDDPMLEPESSYVPLWPSLNHDPDSDFEDYAGTDSTEDEDADENNFSDLIFSSVLELIISSKLMESSANVRASESDQAAECKTPAHPPLLTGIAETCPPAPMRRSLFFKGFDRSICRKLDFESSVN